FAFPANIGEPIREARLISHPDGPQWFVIAADGPRWRHSAVYRIPTPPLVHDEADRIAPAPYVFDHALEPVAYYPPGEAPIEARAIGAVWQARFADGVNLYIDDATGEVLFLRTGQWRLYDLMWGLHIMDPQTREDTQNPFVIVFALVT